VFPEISGFRIRIRIGSAFLTSLDPDPDPCLIIQLKNSKIQVQRRTFFPFLKETTLTLMKKFKFFHVLKNAWEKTQFLFSFFTLKNQALDRDPHLFSKPWIRIRMKWMQIRNPVQNENSFRIRPSKSLRIII